MEVLKSMLGHSSITTKKLYDIVTNRKTKYEIKNYLKRTYSLKLILSITVIILSLIHYSTMG